MRKITKEMFEAYEQVRKSGATNMWDVDYVCELADLSEDEVIDIMKNYRKYYEEFIGKNEKE